MKRPVNRRISMIIRDIVDVVADHVIDLCAPRYVRVRSCNHVKGILFQEVIYIQEDLFDDAREFIRRIGERESLSCLQVTRSHQRSNCCPCWCGIEPAWTTIYS